MLLRGACAPTDVLLGLFGRSSRVLGSGATSTVYLGYDPFAQRDVAIKVAFPEILKHPERGKLYTHLFMNEASLVGKLAHPHIVQIYSYGEENGQPYIVMELVDGNRLDHLQEKHKALDEAFVLQTAIQVIQGLQAANAYGVRDLHGLVWEWTGDASSLLIDGDNRKQGDADKSKFCGAGALSMRDRDNYAVLMRVAMLSSLEANDVTANMGFRCAR